ncbi:hypothetical protein D8Q48_16625 [Ruminococcus sp. B05]|nr:hypothetical protein D8Q48_16625 [Ruminococcus sp. B05]
MNRVHFFIQLFPWYIQYVDLQFEYQFMLSIIIIIITIIDKGSLSCIIQIYKKQSVRKIARNLVTKINRH